MQVTSTPIPLTTASRELEIAPKALAVVLKRHQPIMTECLDQFLIAQKGSQDAVIAGEKLDLFLKNDANSNSLTHKPHTGLKGKFPAGTPGLSASIEANRPWLFKKLISHPNIDLNQGGKLGLSPLESAIRQSNLSAFQILLSGGAATITKPAMDTAACYGRTEMLNAMIEAYNVDPKSFAQKGLTLSQTHQDILKQQAIFQEKEIDRLKRLFPSERQDCLNETVKEAETSIDPAQLRRRIIALAQAGVNLDERHRHGETALYRAANQGKVDLLKSLIEAGADLEQDNKYNNTPVGQAAFNGHDACLKLLIEAGANLNRGNMINIYPVYAAASMGHTNAVRLLIENGADFRRPCMGKTPFQTAIDAKKYDTVKLLESYMPEDEVRALRKQNMKYQNSRSVIW